MYKNLKCGNNFFQNSKVFYLLYYFIIKKIIILFSHEKILGKLDSFLTTQQVYNMPYTSYFSVFNKPCCYKIFFYLFYQTRYNIVKLFFHFKFFNFQLF